MSQSSDSPLRRIPSVDRMLRTAPLKEALARHPRWAVLEATRGVLEEERHVAASRPEDADPEGRLLALATQAALRVASAAEYSLRNVINATGVVLHTNLGRSVLPPAALTHLTRIASRYSNVELDLSTGERGSRYMHVEDLLCRLTGAEAALVVNNNAAAVMLALAACGEGREVIVSRGELVEIGGSFRIPDVMRLSGAILVEVGTTNRTHPEDYEAAITERTAMLLKVHRSNFRIAGFTSEVPMETLVAMAKKRGIATMNDLGSGCLVDLGALGLPPEATVSEAVGAGPDLVTFSGDKMLGGPQIGVIAGRRSYIDRLKKHQLLRALRVDKLTLAALEATLRVYRDARNPAAEIPALRMLAMPLEELQKRADAFVLSLSGRLPAGVTARTVPGNSQVGGGSLPDTPFPTVLVAVRPPNGKTTTEVERRLRARHHPVLARVYAGDILFDLRTVFPDEEEALAAAVVHALQAAAGP